MKFTIFHVKIITISLGRVVSGWRVRNNQDWTLIGKKSPQVAITIIAIIVIAIAIVISITIAIVMFIAITGATDVLPSGDRYDFVCGRRCGS